MKQFKTDEEQFRKFLTRVTRITELLQKEYLVNTNNVLFECDLVFRDIETYKKELGMYQHPDAVKSTKYIEQEIPFVKC